ncbi:GntR family transcriptional regulator [uncultured Cohaesibacter sp.]|uniref:GntR family transcriptional regulator n=1 Tax=uncultured Cohaesibacter sp. TaxID=1002546 RepID=UPI0029C7C7F1|nr:GntR family transcriptional regulator [uncultured Cohaesibacter sp.]
MESGNMETIVRPKSLTELVAEKLMDMIVNGSLELGAQVSEARIAKDFDVSRTPVREAFNRLEMEGLLKLSPQKGTFVFSLSAEELVQLCDARVCLEKTAFQTAIANNPEELHAQLTDVVQRMTEAREAGDDNLYLSLDTVFHQCLFDCSKNHFLNDAYQAISKKMAAIRNRLGRHPEHMNKSFREHCEMVDAVKKRDVELALNILSMHIDRIEGSYWKMATIKASEGQEIFSS